MANFNGKTVVVTGGSSGIGLATAIKLAEKGAAIWLLARRLEALEKARAEVKSYCHRPDQYVEIKSVEIDDADQVQEKFGEIIEQTGVPDILINSAGITYPGYLQELDLNVIQSMINTNFMGIVSTTKAVLPGMLNRGSGSIINIASMGAIISLPGYSGYGASKFAVRGFSESLRTEVRRHGVHVSIVYPGDTDTPQLKNELPLRPEEVNILSSDLDSVLSPDEVANQIIRGIVKKDFMIIPGWNNQLLFWIHTLTGPFAYKIVDYLVGWALNKSNHNNTHPKTNNR